MEIPKEIVDNRVLVVTPDTDLELIISVEHYNSRMALGRRQMLGLMRLGRIFLLLNVTLLMTVGVIGIKTGGVFLFEPRVEWLEYTAIGLYAAAFVWFGLIKRNLIVLTAFSFLLIFMDVRCGIMVAVNILFAVIHGVKQYNVRNRQGYPLFRSIHIERENGKASDVHGQTENENFEKTLDKSKEK